MKLNINEMIIKLNNNPTIYNSDEIPAQTTINAHISRIIFILKKVFNIVDTEEIFNTVILNNVKKISDFLKIRYDENQAKTKQKLISSILFFLRGLNLHLKYKKKINGHTNTYKKYIDLSKTFTPTVLQQAEQTKQNKTLKRVVTKNEIKEIVEIVEKKIKQLEGIKKLHKLNDLLIIQLYTTQTVIRVDYVDTKIIFDNTDKVCI